LPSFQRIVKAAPSMNQMPSSGKTSSGGGSSTFQGAGGTGHWSTVAATSFFASSTRAAPLEFVRIPTPTLSAGETYTAAMKPGIEPPWPARMRSPSRCSIRPSP